METGYADGSDPKQYVDSGRKHRMLEWFQDNLFLYMRDGGKLLPRPISLCEIDKEEAHFG